MANYIYVLLLITSFLSIMRSQSTQIFYSPNVQGINQVYSINVSSSANFSSTNMIGNTELGDGNGIAGPTRCAAQNTAQNNNFVFIANEGSNSISTYEYDRTSGNLVIKTTKVIPGYAQDLSIVTSIDGTLLFVTSSHFLTPNKLFSYSINELTGELTELYNFVFGTWMTSSPLPLRISSVSVSPDGNYVFVGFTSNGGYLAVFRINPDGTLIQIGTTLQNVLNNKTSAFTVANNQVNKIYTAQGNELIVSVGVYSFDSGLILQELKTVTYPVIGGATSISISPDNTLLFVTTTNKVVVFPIDSNGIPNATLAYNVYNTEFCLSVVGVNIARCGRIFVINTNGFQVYQRISQNEIVLRNQWSIDINSPGGATLIDGTEECCSDPTLFPIINILPEYIIDCADEIPSSPIFTVTNSITFVVEKRYEVVSKCNGRPDVIFNITIIDECGRPTTATTRYTRIDKTPPKVEVVGGSGFYLQCGETVPTFNFDFISVSDDCSPMVVSCSRVFDVQRFQCIDNTVGKASSQITYYDSAINTTPGPIQTIHIIDTIPPVIEPFQDTLRVFDSICTLPDFSNAPSVTSYDMCSNVNVTGPLEEYKACGVYELVWFSQDECSNVAKTSYYWKLTEMAKAPQFTNLERNIYYNINPNITNYIDLSQGNKLLLSQSCNPNFLIENLYGNEETSVTISLIDSQVVNSEIIANIYEANWKLVYCGNVSNFVQQITVTASNEDDFTKIIWDSSINRFKIIIFN